MSTATTLYTRHLKKCSHRDDRNYHRCGCPVWFQRDRKRWLAGTRDWAEALKKAAARESGEVAKAPSTITVAAAIDLYLVKRSKCKDATKAPYKDRYMLLTGSERQPSLSTWATGKGFKKLRDVTGAALDTWRDSWVYRPGSYALKIHSALVKAFFTWAVKFEYLDKNPFDKLDPIQVHEVPTLPLTPEEFSKLLASVTACKEQYRETMTTLMLTMRWSGLAIRDATCLRRDALGADNRLRTYRKKTGEYVHVKLPAFVADMLRAHGCMHPDYFFWNRTQCTAESKVSWVEHQLLGIYNEAGITPRGAHRLRDTFAVENLNAGMTIEELASCWGILRPIRRGSITRRGSRAASRGSMGRLTRRWQHKES
jgi:site-specific recombinase XerD